MFGMKNKLIPWQTSRLVKHTAKSKIFKVRDINNKNVAHKNGVEGADRVMIPINELEINQN
jgi:hypothetical protein